VYKIFFKFKNQNNIEQDNNKKMELVNLEETRVEKFDIRNCILCKKNVLDEKLFTFTIPCCNMSICYGCWLKKLCFGNAKEGQVFGSCGNHNPEFLNCASYSIKESPCLRKIIECGCKDGPYYYSTKGGSLTELEGNVRREHENNGCDFIVMYDEHESLEDCKVISCWNGIGAFNFVKGNTRLERLKNLLDHLDFDKRKLEIHVDFDKNIMQLDIFTEVKIARLENVKSKLEKDYEEYCKNNVDEKITSYDFMNHKAYQGLVHRDMKEAHDNYYYYIQRWEKIKKDGDPKAFDILGSIFSALDGDADIVLLKIEAEIESWQIIYENYDDSGTGSCLIIAIKRLIDCRIQELQQQRQEFLDSVEKKKQEYSSVEMKEYQQEHQALKDMLDGKIDCDDSNTIHVLRKRFDKICKMDFWWHVPKWYVRKFKDPSCYKLQTIIFKKYYPCLYRKYFNFRHWSSLGIGIDISKTVAKEFSEDDERQHRFDNETIKLIEEFSRGC
jgi:hypothetical protein